MKLKVRLTLTVVSLVALFVTSVAVVLLVRAQSLQSEEIYENIANLTGMYATRLQSMYENYYYMAKSMADVMSSYKSVAPEERRERYSVMLRSVMESNPEFLGMFAVWDVNAVDGDDAAHANTAGTDASGRYMPFFTRRDGQIEERSLSSYEQF
ncbi:MAG: methyl-accepting chemotaxis protein, partial [Treponema sp.]|nr:methyl-accepting chemotaxis protein [Treponema sp.]